MKSRPTCRLTKSIDNPCIPIDEMKKNFFYYNKQSYAWDASQSGS